ncbi:MAG: NAD(P)-binding protein [Candidatus Omnitrophica bacterium]|nr:NAD(P)-binding protein [Candidatus Omnitrophota bacterium]
MFTKFYECCILGAGPAGLGAALKLVTHGITDILIIDRNKVAGGLARTEVRDGARFDLGPHRFFTRSGEVNKLWHDNLGAEFKSISRLTRVFYKNNYFEYPIRPFEVLAKLDFLESLGAITSFFFFPGGGKKTACHIRGLYNTEVWT